MNSIFYHLIIVRYSMKTLHWYFLWATALHLYNMTGRGEKLQQLHCYHPFSDSLDIDLTKNHYENYSPKMVPIAKIWGSGSWTILHILQGSFRLCNWLSLRRLVSRINHLPLACWSTFWKSNFKQQLGCRFDIIDNESFFFLTYAIICLDTSDHFSVLPS